MMNAKTVDLDIASLGAGLLEPPEPLIIAGPCSAETEDQVMETAHALATTKRVTVFRAGIWKPRTRPNQFEGVGSVGLRWLGRVKAETALLTAVEVASARHVEESLEHGIDILWVGARTTANPFSVQEIASALRGVQIPVLVKNPINPDLQLWIGALERLNQAGVTRLAAVHRGFSTYDKTRFRNAPNWSIPIELRRLAPSLPMLCDPSHIAGQRHLLREIAQEAMDLGMAGLMIESHVTPTKALSDAAQQVTPRDLDALLSSLVLRKPFSSRNDFVDQLADLRRRIDALDTELLGVLSARMSLVSKIGEHKANNGITALQLDRWTELLQERVKTGCGLELDERFVGEIFQIIHNESLTKQISLMNSKLNKDTGT